MKKKIAGLSAFIFVVLFVVVAVFGFAACSYDNAKEVSKFGSNSSGDSGSGSTPIMRVFVPDLNDPDDAAAMALGDEYFAGCDFTVEQTFNDNGEAVYWIGGTSSQMTDEVAEWFTDGAEAGDEYVTLKIYVEEGATISFSAHDKDKSFTNDGSPTSGLDGDYLYLVFRLSGTCEDGTTVNVPELFDFTVTWTETVITTETVQVEKLDENGEPVLDDEGNPITEDEVVAVENKIEMSELFHVSFFKITLSGETKSDGAVSE